MPSKKVQLLREFYGRRVRLHYPCALPLTTQSVKEMKTTGYCFIGKILCFHLTDSSEKLGFVVVGMLQ
jgi:hypothetical protein